MKELQKIFGSILVKFRYNQDVVAEWTKKADEGKEIALVRTQLNII